jgi:haloalkane dehalogenase
MSVPAWLDRAAWPYAGRWLALDEGRLHYIDEGAGAPVVFVHGTPTWCFEWRHIVAGLHDRVRVLAPDHLGFGLSDRPARAGYRPEDHARRFGAWLTAVLPEDRIHLVVHDFGGPIALDWALEHADRLRSLTVINSWMWSFADDPLMRRRARLAGGTIGRLLYRRFNASLRLIMPSAYGDRRALTPAIHEQYLSVFPDHDSRERVLFALAQSLLRSSAYFDSLWARRSRLAEVPMHLVWGLKDSAFQSYILDRWRQAFPHATITTLPGAGHWPHEEDPAVVLEAIQRTIAPGSR